MKIKSLLIGMLACSAMVACTNEDVIDNPNVNPESKDGNAYMAIRLVNATGVASRAEGDYEDGLEAENEVSTATFYFFDAEGSPLDNVQKATSWYLDEDKTDHIEKISDAVITLNNKTHDDALKYKYVIAVLNEPTPGQFKTYTKEQIETTLATSEGFANLEQDDQNKPTHIKNESGNFVMTNSTYVDGTKIIVASEITEDNILMQEPDEEELNYKNAVTIYVERLAAKVRVGLKTGLVDADNCIALTNAIETYNEETKEIVRSEEYKIYINISGWGLNGTTKDSYLAKKLNSDWLAANATDPGYAWNTHAANNLIYRNYWGMSTNYGNDDAYYPGTFFENANQYVEGNKGEDGQEVQGTDANNAEVTLNYYSWNELSKGFTGANYDYCAENTNNKDVLLDGNFFSKVTSVVVKAQVAKIAKVGEDGTENILKDADNNNITTLVKYAGKLYTMDAFKARIYNEVNIKAYKKTVVENETKTSSVDWREYITINDAKDGFISLGMNITDNDDWFSDAECKVKLTKSSISSKMALLHTTENNRTFIAECYNKGMMFYNIPIKHLKAGEYVKASATEEFSVEEGQYGVVRNHLYDITINSIVNMGEAVYNEYEDIIVETNDDDKWYIGAAMYILSWKIVNQGVDL